MAISVSPDPNDGPLKASGPNVTVAIRTTSGATLTAVIRTTSGAMVPIENMLINSGTNIVRLNFPPGGVPPGSTLILIMDEPLGQKTVVKYKLA